MELFKKIRERAKKLKRKIILPETEERRVLQAAKIISDEGLAKLILLAEPKNLKIKAEAIGLDLNKVEVINPLQRAELKQFGEEFFSLRKHKGVTPEEAQEQVKKFVYFAAMMVRHNLADGFVAGAGHTTADVAKAAIYCVGFSEKIKTISSCFLLSVPDCAYGENGVFVFADCGIIPDPSPMQLANIANSAADVYKLLVGSKPRIALLSFSTKGSAKHPLVDKIIRAKEIIEQEYPDLTVDGELQLDAAIVPEVAKIKAPESRLAGTANVLIFPNLDAGNIAYKLVQRLAKAEAIGPLMLGLKKPCSDLSRGCDVEEIVNVVCATAIRLAA